MNFFKKVKLKNTHLILDFQGIFLLFFISLLIIFIFPFFISFLTFLTFSLREKYLLGFILYSLAFIFHYIYSINLIIFHKKKFYFIELFFLFPKLHIKEPLEHIYLKKSFQEDPKNNAVQIFLDNDLWEDFGFADWIGIKYKNKEFTIGGNENYKILFEEIKKSLKGSKKN